MALRSMYKLDSISKKRLQTCHPNIQTLCAELLKHYKFKIEAGYLGRTDQDEMYKEGTMPARYPDSPHNTVDDGKPCSIGIRLIPYDFKGKRAIYGKNARAMFYIAYFAGLIQGISKNLDISMKWSGTEFPTAHTFCDNHVNMFNWELETPKN